MSHSYRFPIKGSYYYSADKAFKQQLIKVGNTLYLHPEPNNEHDCYALQIWTHPNGQGYLIGYVPRQLAKQWRPLLTNTHQASNTHSQEPSWPIKLCVALARGKQLRLECQIQLNLTWLKHLQTLSWTHWLRQQQTLKWWLNARRKKRFQR